MDELHLYFSWFESYVKQFYSDNEEIHTNIKLKEAHTFRVCKIAEKLIKSLHLAKDEEVIALLCALFHDLGRFKQFAEFQTFRDQDSINHAALSVDLLKHSKLLTVFPQSTQDIIYSAIYCHNATYLPEDLRKSELFHTQILRDADKLDIYYVVTEYYKDPIQNKYQAVGKNIAKEHGFSPKILSQFLNKGKISYGDVETMDDLKVLQLSWIYDLNFSFSIEYLERKEYIPSILSTLPQSEEKDLLNQKVFNFFGNKN